MVVRTRSRRSVREIRGLDSIAMTAAAEPATTGFSPLERDARALITALERLDADKRAILALRHLEGRGIPEIAAILDIPEGTAKSRLFVARKALQAILAEDSGP
jgi:RNA polymerase sigma-70 factor (ECF subfamily)